MSLYRYAKNKDLIINDLLEGKLDREVFALATHLAQKDSFAVPNDKVIAVMQCVLQYFDVVITDVCPQSETTIVTTVIVDSDTETLKEREVM